MADPTQEEVQFVRQALWEQNNWLHPYAQAQDINESDDGWEVIEDGVCVQCEAGNREPHDFEKAGVVHHDAVYVMLGLSGQLVDAQTRLGQIQEIVDSEVE